jgi:protein ImuA
MPKPVMTRPQPAALAILHSRAAVIEELRRLLPRIEDFCKILLPFGLAALDSHLPMGGLACGALHEVMPETQSATPAAFGFIAAVLGRLMHNGAAHSANSPPHPDGGRVFLVIPAYGQREYGRPHGHGLSALGLDPARLIQIETMHRRETLWALEEALRSGAPTAVAGIIDKLDLKSSQRLHLAATDSGVPLLLLRPTSPFPPSPTYGEGWEASAAATRWRVGPAKAARDRFGLFARARWHLRLERCRNGRPGEWVVEYDHVAHRFSLAAALADPALSCSASETALRQAYRA